MKQYRQGDVFLEEVLELPREVELIPGPIVLAHGEVTGHAHTVANRCAKFFRAPNGKRFLEVMKKTRVLHQEHDSITLDVGIYEISQQREYSPEKIRTVAD